MKTVAIAGATGGIGQAFQCNQLLVVDDANHLIGALNLHDLLKAKVF